MAGSMLGERGRARIPDADIAYFYSTSCDSSCQLGTCDNACEVTHCLVEGPEICTDFYKTQLRSYYCDDWYM